MDHCKLVVAKAGHTAGEENIKKELVKASDYFKNKV